VLKSGEPRALPPSSHRDAKGLAKGPRRGNADPAATARVDRGAARDQCPIAGSWVGAEGTRPFPRPPSDYMAAKNSPARKKVVIPRRRPTRPTIDQPQAFIEAVFAVSR